MESIVYSRLAFVVLVGILSLIAPTRVAYTERITVDAPIMDVYDDIRLQEHLMRWSTWPKDTKSTCTVEGPYGQVGAKSAFFTKGNRVGHLEGISLKENEEVALTLVGPGLPHHPRLTFELQAIGENLTKVLAPLSSMNCPARSMRSGNLPDCRNGRGRYIARI
ncbi:MAG: hypothetical protein R8G34_11390 [Paracoccaceae bacterium]|nr:hypothetical protein [Paracoccaceae bacterium]